MESQKPDYYTGKKRKIIEFLIGFFCLPLILTFSLAAMNYFGENVSFGLLILFRLIQVSLLILFLFLVRKRKFVAYGIKAMFAVLLIVGFGTCLFPR